MSMQILPLLLLSTLQRPILLLSKAQARESTHLLLESKNKLYIQIVHFKVHF